MALKLRALREALLLAGAALQEAAKAVDEIADYEARIAMLEARLALERRPIKRHKVGRPSKGGLHKTNKRLADGTIETYWYAYKGGPRLSEEEAEFIRNGN